MSTPAAISGSLADFRIVKTRSVVQFIVEVPIEQADVALATLGGIPLPGVERPVALARLNQEPEQRVSFTAERTAHLNQVKEVVQTPEQLSTTTTPPATLSTLGAGSCPSEVHREAAQKKSLSAKEQYRQLPEWEQARVRACALCNDGKFQMWASTQQHPRSVFEDAAAWMRYVINIKSRSEIGVDRKAYERFIALETAYKQATGQMAEAR